MWYHDDITACGKPVPDPCTRARLVCTPLFSLCSWGWICRSCTRMLVETSISRPAKFIFLIRSSGLLYPMANYTTTFSYEKATPKNTESTCWPSRKLSEGAQQRQFSSWVFVLWIAYGNHINWSRFPSFSGDLSNYFTRGHAYGHTFWQYWCFDFIALPFTEMGFFSEMGFTIFCSLLESFHHFSNLEATKHILYSHWNSSSQFYFIDYHHQACLWQC